MSGSKPDYDWDVAVDDAFWVPVKLTEEQHAKCLLFEIMIYKNCDNGKYIITKDDLYVRPIDIKNAKPNGGHVEVDTFEECLMLAADPEKFGGSWG